MKLAVSKYPPSMAYHLTPLGRTALRKSKTAYPRFNGCESGFRFFSPGIGRWASRDPINEQGFHLHTAFPHGNAERRQSLQVQMNPRQVQLLALRGPNGNIEIGTITSMPSPLRGPSSSGPKGMTKEFGDNKHEYVFVGNAPVLIIDPHGLKCILTCVLCYHPYGIASCCYPSDDFLPPKCECSNPCNLPTWHNWVHFYPPIGVGPFPIDWDPCHLPPPPGA